MFKETKLYLFLLGVLGVAEFISAIPLMVESILYTDSLYLVFVVGALHLVAYLFAGTGLVEYHHKSTHLLGMLAMLMNFIPIVNFIPHLFVIIKLLGDFNKIFKQYNSDVEERKVFATLKEDEDAGIF